jgi:hypothetical protein
VKEWLPVAVGVAALLTAPLAVAEPIAPQPDSACSSDVAGALTQSADRSTVLRCDGASTSGYRWHTDDDPYPHSDRWLSYGPAITLDGDGQRSREVDSGDWTGYPQSADVGCTATQHAIAAAGGAAPPDSTRGEPGQPLRVRLAPLLLSVEFGGYCLWQRG